MDLQKLKIFVDLSKTLNYTDTAENLFTTQGNISKQVMALEKELGVSLFKRAHRKIEMTQQGEIVLPYAKKILLDYNELSNKLNDFQAAKNLTIEMHTIPTMPSYQSFTLITQFLQKHPEVHMQLREEESYNLITSLKSGKCEIIFARTFDFDDPDLERIVTEEDKFVAVLPRKHPLAKSKKLTISQLKDDPFLILGKSTNLYDPVIKLCRQAHFTPKIAYEGTRVDLIMQMVQNNMGISIMMQKTAQNFDSEEFSIVPLTTNIANELCFIRVKGEHSSANNLFWRYIQTNLKVLQAK
ncbi:LysR family transcriptional regulator [Companilactobacillus kimchii]|uniref:LysR family transcriptional regulator n=2 Tax=Companilactobacillus kimchii TaxID=2801452 RepID=A0ABR5NR13_9LACO|nr:LysR family transcriptional regulator [Companilactobacillus kimchii]GEO47887.1 LysR family transcriptional regulator [Companilactobacillus paralimentarius]KAE9559080.1 LysR family transcriptional regulator [Companilactobacillus kimchii]KAE9560862.1 LysR family transcriptional regulator [Companilactobacillus kimchii]KRK50158.1 LysR family transcriptional regulator [Companilactobacillus kimchii DSM 13961 = JCM 10707]OWF32197.1 HTH-type transcriptional activator IlvY [Companilactobacillus kimc